MTKTELDRIKKAYSSGLKVQIWFNGHWEDFDIRDYSMYPEPFSENRQYRIVGSAYADIAEKRITELKKENAELKEKLKHRNCVDCSNHGSNIKLLKAKEIIKKIENIFYSGEDALKRLSQISDTLKEAEAFLKEE